MVPKIYCEEWTDATYNQAFLLAELTKLNDRCDMLMNHDSWNPRTRLVLTEISPFSMFKRCELWIPGPYVARAVEYPCLEFTFGPLWMTPGIFLLR
jgi:hypothetical protein